MRSQVAWTRMSLSIRLGMKSGGQADCSSKKAAKLRPEERGGRSGGVNVPTGETEHRSLKGQQNLFLVSAWVLFTLYLIPQVTAPMSLEEGRIVSVDGDELPAQNWQENASDMFLEAGR